MASFDINFTEVKNSVVVMEKAISNYESDMKTLKGSLNNVDGYWKDRNTDVFIETVKKDYSIYSSHISSIKKYVNTIEKFCEDMKKMISNKTGIKSINKLKINSDKISNMVSALSDVYTYLDNCVYYLNNLSIPADFSYRWTLNNYLGDFRYYRGKVNDIKNNLRNINNEINEIINEYKVTINKMNNIEINKNVISYKWHVSADPLKKIDNDFTEKKVSVNPNISSNINLKNPDLVVKEKDIIINSRVDAKLSDEYEGEIEVIDYSFGSVLNEKLENQEYELDSKTYNVNQSINEEFKSEEYNLDSKLYNVNQNTNKEMESQEYNLNSNIYSINQDNQNNQSLGQSSINLEQNDYRVNENNTNNNLGNVGIDIKNNDYNVNYENKATALNKVNVDVSNKSYTVNNNTSTGGLNSINMSVNARQYDVNNNINTSNLSTSNIEVQKKDIDILDLNS